VAVLPDANRLRLATGADSVEKLLLEQQHGWPIRNRRAR
jgi:hypothetical protein